MINAVGEVRKAVDVTPEGPLAEEMFPPPPDLSQLHISGTLTCRVAGTTLSHVDGDIVHLYKHCHINIL